MLTPKEIERARSIVKDEAASRTVLDALAAYERVTALLERWDDLPFVTLIREGVVRELREALAG
jgi:hypothetical protein